MPRREQLNVLIKSLPSLAFLNYPSPASTPALKAAQTSCRARLRLAVSNPLIIPCDPPLLLLQIQPEDEVSTALHP